MGTIGAARYAGSRVARVEDARLLTGEGTFVDDVSRPGMLHACFVRSPVARARIAAIDVSEARTVAGVHAVFLAADLNPGAGEQWHTSIGPDAPETPRPPLAEDEVRYVGDPVALVVADSRYVAEDAAELVVVDYDDLTPVVDYAAAEGADAVVHDHLPNNVIGKMSGPPPEKVEAAFASAAHVVAERLEQHAYAAVPIETRGMVLEWSGAGGGELTIWAASQVPHEVRIFCSRLLGLPEHRIRVIARDTGGGFGQKAFIQREEMCLMLAAPLVPGPLKWIEDRRENLLSAGQARHESALAQMAFDADGTILAARIDHLLDAGRTRRRGRSGRRRSSVRCSPGPTGSPSPRSRRSRCTPTPSGAPPTGARGPSRRSRGRCSSTSPPGASVMDPIELRRRNLLRTDELPMFNPNGMPYDDITPAETFEQALEMLDYEAFRKEQAAARAEGRHLGVGHVHATSSRPRPASASTPPRVRRSASSPRARSTSTWPAARPGTASRPPWCR